MPRAIHKELRLYPDPVEGQDLIARQTYNDRSKKRINGMKESFFAESLPDMLLSLQKTHPIAGIGPQNHKIK